MHCERHFAPRHRGLLVCGLLAGCFSDPPGGTDPESTGTAGDSGTSAATSAASSDATEAGTTNSTPVETESGSIDGTTTDSTGGPMLCVPDCSIGALVCESFESDWSNSTPPWMTAGNGPSPTLDQTLATCGEGSARAAAAAGDPYSALQVAMPSGPLAADPHLIVMAVHIDPQCTATKSLRLAQFQLWSDATFAYYVEVWIAESGSELRVVHPVLGTLSSAATEPMAPEVWHRLEVRVDFSLDSTDSPGLSLRIDDHAPLPFEDAHPLQRTAFTEPAILVVGPYPGPNAFADPCAVNFDEVAVMPSLR